MDFEVEALLPGFRASPVGYIVFAACAGITPIFGGNLIDGNLNLIRINFFTLSIIVILLLVWVFKIVATELTVWSGGVREVFAPFLCRRLSGRGVLGRDQPVFPAAMPAPS